MQTSVGNFSLQNSGANIELHKDRHSTLHDLLSGEPLQLRITLPPENPLPRFIEIIHNDRQLCTGSPGES